MSKPVGQRCGGSGERGSEILEFAFSMTVLMMAVLGIVTFARAFEVYQSLTRATREGARMAVLTNCATCGDSFLDPSSGVTQGNSAVFANYIAPAMQAANLNPNAVTSYSETIGWLDTGDTEAQCGVTIRLQYPYQLYLPFTNLNLTTLTLGARVQMRREQQTTTGTCP